ncbi:MAG TPA: hypothetical protein DCW86_02780 [Actinobacteria bacterium]|nr:hypothetical protein [Actinomycetota bacterium]
MDELISKGSSLRISRWSRGLIEYGLMALVFLLPLASSPHSFLGYDVFKVALLRIFFLLLASAWLVKIVVNGKTNFVQTPLDLPLGALLFVGAVSTLFSTNIKTSFLGDAWRQQGFFVLLIYIFLYYLTLNFYTQERHFRLFSLALFASCCLVSLVGILSYLGVTFGSWSFRFGLDPQRIAATLGNPVYLGAYLVLVIPVAIVLVFDPAFERWNLLKALAGFTLLLSLPCLVFTHTRAAWLGFLVCLLFLLILRGKSFWREKTSLLVVVTLVVAAIFIVGAVHDRLEEEGAPHAVGVRAASIAQLREGSIASRLGVWSVSLRIIADHPLIGTGPDTFWEVFPRYLPVDFERVVKEEARPASPHNDFLEVASSMGFLGLVAYLWVLVTLFFFALTTLRQNRLLSADDPTRLSTSLITGLLGGLIGYLVQLQFSFHVVGAAPFFWLFIGLLVSTTGVRRPIFWRLNFLSMPWMRPLPYLLIGLIVAVGAWFASAPAVADFHAGRADELAELGLHNQAILEARRAIRSNPFEEEYLFLLGKIYEAKGESMGDLLWQGKAIEAYKRALKLNPRDRNTHAHLADAYLRAAEAGDEKAIDKAFLAYRRLIEFEPNYSTSHYNLGVAYYLKGELDEAIAEWEKAIELNPTRSKPHLLLGKVYEEMGELSKAISFYEKALELDLSNTEAREALERLK